MKDWNLLKDDEIIGIIIGDILVKEDCNYDYKMPYMKIEDIYEFSRELGFQNKCNFDDKKSREKAMEELINYINEKNKINRFFEKIMNKKRFQKFKQQREVWLNQETIYYETITNLIKSINKILNSYKCHIEFEDVLCQKFVLIDDEEIILLDIKKIKEVDRRYITTLYKQIKQVVKNGDYESAITKSRTIIEEILAFGIEKKGEIPTEKGNMNLLYSQFKTLYKMHQDANVDKRINGVLSGIEKIITSIIQMRDKNSDSHGVGDRRIELEKYQVMLFVNSAISLSEFLLEVINKNI